ncbi:MAG: hypothetical protein RLY31_1367 [Bacteroidota bacterium]|jgi:sugar phosphate isomerase/epimerase
MTNWEYWPMFLSNLPLVPIWLWFAIRAREAFFFSAVNPVIETGGLWGESKYNILRRIPAEHLPQTMFVPADRPREEVLSAIEAAGYTYPLIVKPDVGERGFLVARLESREELEGYLARYRLDLIVQEYVPGPLEIAVMYHRFPGERRGAVTSVCLKETLRVKGDGVTTVAGLLAKDPRGRLQRERLAQARPTLMSSVPEAGRVVEVEPIGNHSRGTKFLNGNHHIDAVLSGIFDGIACRMEDIHYGRFDIRCVSLEDLRAGRGFRILEFNGVGGEPAHIYDPSFPVLRKYRDIYRHWRIIYEIYRRQVRVGVRGMTFHEAWHQYKRYSHYKKRVGVS